MKMTPQERDAKVDALKPAWAKEYIRQLEDLTRDLARRISPGSPEPAAQPPLMLTEGEALVAWRAVDAMSEASRSPEDDEIIKRVTEHFAAQLPERPDDPARGDPDPEPGYAVYRVVDGAANMNPLLDLPDRAEIVVAEKFQVHYGTHEATAGARVLVIEGFRPLIIRSVDPGTILIATE